VRDLSLVEQALDTALDAQDYLEVPEASNAVAAVEVLAKTLGKGTQSDAYTENIDAWVRSLNMKPSAALLDKAKRALERIAGENSELRELWDDAGADEWERSIAALRSAISY
jgi:Domain of unknown function (DUF4259)